MLEMLKNQMFFFKISNCSRGGRAHVARIVFYLTGIVLLASARMSLKEFNASAKVARAGPFERNVENHWFF